VFESLYEKRDDRSRRLLILLGGALVLHAVVLTVVLVVEFMRVPPVPQPAVTITLIDAATLAPPPPPPPPPKRPKPKIVAKRIDQSKEMLAPKEIPKEIPKDEPAADNGAGDDSGGVVGGVVGGVAGGVVSTVAPPPPPPPPPKPIFQATEAASKRRISGSEPEYPYRARIQGWEATLIARVHISPSGTVERVEFVQTDPNFEDSVRKAVATWRFKPHVVDGKPVSTYTVMKFVFKLE
jgi:protein TonB